MNKLNMLITGNDILENQSLTVFLSIVCVFIMLFVIFFLFYRYLKESKRYKAELKSYIEGILTKREIYAAITSYINKLPDNEFSLIGIDIDRFREVNEALGKDEADKLLRMMIYKIQEIVPKRVDIARIDVDQFLVFIKGEYELQDAIDLAKKILYIISTPFKIYSGTQVELTASVGIVRYPYHGTTLRQLLDSIDIAIYQVKRDGGNKYAVYSPEASKELSQNLEYYREIKDGIKNKEFTLYYQPIIDCKNKNVFAFEGLLRWNHPKLGVLSPNKFINIMEQSGDISWIGEMGIEQIMKEVQELEKAGYNDVIFTLNLSAKQLIDAELPAKISKLLKQYRIEPNRIAFEFGEFTLYDRQEVMRKNMKALKDIGFKIAVNGVGLDFNGIKKLEEMKIDIVKLAKEYMKQDIDDDLFKNKYISLLTNYAEKNNISIVAEGIEDIENLEYAQSLGVNIIQGYNFSSAIEESQVIPYIERKDYLNKMSLKEDEDDGYSTVVSETETIELINPETTENNTNNENETK